jgi:two-component system sensor histidine kinase CiaH
MTTLPFWKPSEVSGIASEDNVFLVARLKLTALYVGILAVIVIGFSLFLYESIYRNLQDSGDDYFNDATSHQHFVTRTVQPIQNTIIISDFLILFIAALLSYALAGSTLRPVRRALEAQRLFSAEASHELRTPLAIMRNEIEVLLRNSHPSPEYLREVLMSNAEEIQKMSTIVEDLLVLARSERSNHTSFTSSNITALLETVVEKMRTLATNKGLTIYFSGEPTVTVNGNAHALERVFVNVLQNSLEHTSTGTITVTLLCVRATAVITITDTGTGIPAEELSHVFTRFYKGSQANGKEGTGLGLAIVKEIVEQHKGTVSIDSIVPGGTTVRISLPLA